MENRRLKTKYESDMDRNCPWGEYPRPSFVRDSFMSLNGEWDYGTGDGEIYTDKILVPFPPESVLSGICRQVDKSGYMYYKKRVAIPTEFNRGRVILHFGAIDQEATVYIGERKVGERLGGYIPFSFDITEYIADEIEIRVVVRDTLDLKYPYGKQTKKRGGMWYTPVSGIWQTVWLESVPCDHIEAVRFTPRMDGVKIEIAGGRVEKTVKIIESGDVYTFDGGEIDLTISEPKLWSPEEPNIYHVEITSGDDKVESYFALRVVDIREIDGKSRICLNGEPYVFNGLLDQGYYPDGIFLPATQDGYRDDILMAKSLGYNMLRKHIKIEPEIFYYLADTLGIAIFQDMINNSDYSFLRDTALPTIGFQKLSDKNLHKNPESRAIFEKTMYETADLLYNHPSIVYYTIFNEGWGQFSSDEMYGKLKSVEPTRIIDSTSGWFRRSKSDVDSRHIYFKALKPKGLDNRPLVISEFGGYSLRLDGHLFGYGNYGYGGFKSAKEFEDAIIKLYETEVLPLVEGGASGFVYTQVSDVEDETNGFVTYDREVLKADPKRIYEAISRCSGKRK